MREVDAASVPCNATAEWQPTASHGALKARAAALAMMREFFAARNVLEVETPALVNAPVSDIHLQSIVVQTGGAPPMFLHTSPEYAMKRLLAAGSGDIYQICKVFRAAERGSQHNPEFTMVEWYRVGIAFEALMSEVAALVLQLLGERGLPRHVEFVNYRDAVMQHAGIDPLEASTTALLDCAQQRGLATTEVVTRDAALDFLVSTCVSPKLGHGALTFLHRYPASQAALARLDTDDPRVALRFELYADGIELANGFHELANARDQRARFEEDQAARMRSRLPVYALDEHLLAALEQGLPDCCGVALGFDRVMMLALGVDRIDRVIAFPFERA
jgi:elongation factor P--(R)-beta-lysine ligase